MRPRDNARQCVPAVHHWTAGTLPNMGGDAMKAGDAGDMTAGRTKYFAWFAWSVAALLPLASHGETGVT